MTSKVFYPITDAMLLIVTNNGENSDSAERWSPYNSEVAEGIYSKPLANSDVFRDN